MRDADKRVSACVTANRLSIPAILLYTRRQPHKQRHEWAATSLVRLQMTRGAFI
jgi:hypothetical protein